MHELLSSFLSNESRFGRVMTRCGIIIAANILFVLFSLPVVTTGAALTALYHVMFKTLRGDGVINPFVQFWIGFRTNFKQSTLAWLLCVLLVLFGWLDVRICLLSGGWVGNLRYAIYGLGVLLFIVMLYLFPTMAAFDNTLPNLARSGIYFALRKPLKLAVNLFFHAFPLFLTYTDAQYQPLYAFLWAAFGFGAIAMLTARLLLPEYTPFLPLVDECGDFILDKDGRQQKPSDAAEPASAGHHELTEKEILEEMKKLGM